MQTCCHRCVASSSGFPFRLDLSVSTVAGPSPKALDLGRCRSPERYARRNKPRGMLRMLGKRRLRRKRPGGWTRRQWLRQWRRRWRRWWRKKQSRVTKSARAAVYQHHRGCCRCEEAVLRVRLLGAALVTLARVNASPAPYHLTFLVMPQRGLPCVCQSFLATLTLCQTAGFQSELSRCNNALEVNGCIC